MDDRRPVGQTKISSRAAEIQVREFESVPYLPIGEYYVRTAFHENLEGVNVGPAIFMWNVTNKE